MPLNILAGLLCVILALGLYSAGTWTASRRGGFGRNQLILLWTGVVFDVLATVMMGLSIGGLDLSPTGWLHTTTALLAWALMFVSVLTGTLAYVRRDEALGLRTSRLILGPWALWVAVFVWGMIARGPRGPA